MASTPGLKDRCIENSDGHDARLEHAVLVAQQELSPDGVLVVDGAGRIVSFNRRFVEMWGIPPQVVESGSDQQALESVLGSLADPEAFLRRVQYLYEHRSEFSRDEEIQLKDGRTFERHSAPISGVGDGGYFGRVWYFRDITLRKRAEAAVAQSAVLNERARLERELISTVSHELRTPTASIVGYSETLLAGGLDDESRRREFVRTIHRHARRLHQLIEDLLDMASLEAGRRPPVPDTIELSGYVGPFLESMIPAAARKGVSLRSDVEAGLRVAVDETHLHRLLTNLLDNAVKYTARGRNVVVRARAEGGGVVLAVADEGIGIPADEMPRVFERFFRARNAGPAAKGTGLGLALVKHLVEANGGTIGVQSAEGRGTTFAIRFPRASS